VARLQLKSWLRSWSEKWQMNLNRRAGKGLSGRALRFLVHRLDPHHFAGLPLSLLLLGIFLNAFILSELAEAIRDNPWLQGIDQFWARYFYLHRHEPWISRIYFFTRTCSSPFVIALTAGITLLAIWRKRYHAWISVLVSLACSSLSALAGKLYYRFPRPTGLAWYEEFSWSFPSGHATLAVAFYGLIFYLIWLQLKNRFLKFFVISVALGFAVVMGFSRVYLGVHYLSDVAGGYAIGLVWFLFSLALLSWLDFRKDWKQRLSA
jgi:undecaprenyl-diphosphatase